MMQSFQQLRFLRCISTRSIYLGAAVAASLALTACGSGGGGGEPLVAEAVVTAVDPVQILENSGRMVFAVHLDKPVQRGLSVTFSTNSTAKSGIPSTGSATGGVSCTGAADFINASSKVVSIPAGSSTFSLEVSACPDAAFEPNETFNLTWTSPGANGGTVRGTIINDDAGGLNSTGAPTVMGPRAAFGRDGTNLLAAGTPLGFSFDTSDPANGASCMIDRVTGLTWQRPTVTQNSDYAGTSNFVSVANGVGLCGKTNWRVPTVNELLSLMDMSKTSAPFNADPDAMGGEYWSSEQVTTATDNAWVVSAAQRGAVTYFNKATDTANVRLVSGGAYSVTDKFSNASACNDSTRYKTDFNDGTVADIKTGLMWKQCAEGASGNQCSATAPTTFASTTSILNRLDAVNADPAGLGLDYSDWRIPTVKELASLVDRCTGTTLAINDSVFPNTQSVSYVSASYDASDNLQFWYVDFSGGTVAVASPANKYLRLVRAGQ
jgi:hypothetical protein